MDAKVDLTNVRLETERLELRPWKLSDLDDFNAYCKVPGVGEMAGWVHHKTKEESEEILKLFITEKKTFAIILKGNQKAIGSVGLEFCRDITNPRLQTLKAREIGYVLSKDYWGQGITAEAVAAVIDYCFKIERYDCLYCGFFLYNKQSQRVNEKLNFRFLKETTRETRYGTQEKMQLNILFNRLKGFSELFYKNLLS